MRIGIAVNPTELDAGQYVTLLNLRVFINDLIHVLILLSRFSFGLQLQ